MRKNCSGLRDGHPLDAWQLFSLWKNISQSSLSELPDRSLFPNRRSIARMNRKFTKGKPFAVVWLEDLTGTIEVVL
jgi:hypothetical protein